MKSLIEALAKLAQKSERYEVFASIVSGFDKKLNEPGARAPLSLEQVKHLTLNMLDRLTINVKEEQPELVRLIVCAADEVKR